MSNYRSILTRVGIVLIAFGILEFVHFLYTPPPDTMCILSANPPPSSTRNVSPSSGGFIFVALGVFFLRGNLQIVRPVTWFAAFSLPFGVRHLVHIPFGFPAELWVIALRIDPISYSLPILVKVIGVPVAWWIYTQLRAAPVVSACVRAGHSATPPKLAFILGIALVAVVSIRYYFFFTPDSVAEAQAVEVAQKEYGEGYKYHVRVVAQYNGQMQACVDAYNEQEIKLVRVEWEP